MKTSMLVMLVMLVVACAGCGPVEFPFELYVDSGFSLEEQCLAVEAVERWKEASSLIDVDVIIADGVREKDEHVVIKAGQNDASEVGAGPEHMGWTEPSGEMFLWSDKVRSNGGNFAENFMGVAAHEFGHHIGLHHDGAKSALMYRKVPTWCVTQRDLDQFCRQRGCMRSRRLAALLPTAAVGVGTGRQNLLRSSPTMVV